MRASQAEPGAYRDDDHGGPAPKGETQDASLKHEHGRRYGQQATRLEIPQPLRGGEVSGRTIDAPQLRCWQLPKDPRGKYPRDPGRYDWRDVPDADPCRYRKNSH